MNIILKNTKQDNEEFNYLFNRLFKDNNEVYKADINFFITLNNINIGLANLLKEQNGYSLGIWIDRPYQNFGIGTYVTKKIIENASLYDINKIIIRTKCNNEKMKKVLQKINIKLDYEEMEKCIEEGVDFLVYSKKIENQKVKKITL